MLIANTVSLSFFQGVIDIHEQLPFSIVATKGTAGSVELYPCRGHEAGGQGATPRSMPGQHGLSRKAYRTAVTFAACNLPSGSDAEAVLKPGSGVPVVALTPQAALPVTLPPGRLVKPPFAHCARRGAGSHTPSVRLVPPYCTSSGDEYRISAAPP